MSSSPLPLAVAALLTFGFVGCMSETRSLNTLEAGNGGEEGDNTPDAGTGGRAAAAGQDPVGQAGRLTGEVGGGPPLAGSAGWSPGGSSNGGLGGDAISAGGPQGGAGSPNGGVPNAGSGALAGFAGNAGGSIAGGAGAPPCNSSDGSGCDSITFCVDNPLDACAPDSESSCSGHCAHPYATPICFGLGNVVACPTNYDCVTEPDSLLGTDPAGICVGSQPPECKVDGDCLEGFRCVPADGGTGKRCSPRRADCRPIGRCSVEPVPTCPVGYAPSEAATCAYVCIPYEQCGCDQDADCVAPSTCDRLAGRCRAPSAAAPRCFEPYDAGPCDGTFRAYAFVDGQCQPVTYGGCEGNDNRFASKAECQSACLGMPLEHDCPEGSVAANGCLGCGPLGGCMPQGDYCFTKCEDSDDCSDEPGFSCVNGMCQVVGCV